MQTFIYRHIEGILIGAVTCIFYILSFAPIYQNYLSAPVSRVYLGSTDYPLDMMGNLASVQEGYRGNWKRFSLITSTIYSPKTLVKFEYILIGQIARIFRIDPLVVFHISRFFISFCFIFFIYRIIFSLFERKIERIVAYIFALFATGILPAISNTSLRILIELPTDGHVFQRMTTSAHHYILGSFFCLVSLYYLAKWTDDKIKLYFFIACIFGFGSSFVYIPTTILVLLSLPFFFLLFLLGKKERRGFQTMFRMGVSLVIYSVIIIIPILYLLYTSQFWEFNTFAKTEKLIPSDISFLNYPMLVGIPFILSLFSIPIILKKKKTLLLLFLPWIIVHPVATLLLSNILSINKLRFFFTPYFLIFALLGIVTVIHCAKIIYKKIKIVPYTVILLVVMFITLYPSKYAYVMSYKANHVCFCTIPLFDYGYPKKEIMDTIKWLSDKSDQNDVVLSGYFAGVLIPAFSGNKVYTSWWFRLVQPSNFDTVISNYYNFYSQKMSDNQARIFLTKSKIRYVFVGGEELPLVGNNGLGYSFLHEATKSSDTILYKVMLNE